MILWLSIVPFSRPAKCRLYKEATPLLAKDWLTIPLVFCHMLGPSLVSYMSQEGHESGFNPHTYTGFEGQSPRELAVHNRLEAGGNYDNRR